MANELSGSVYKIDTTITSASFAATLGTGKTLIQGFFWDASASGTACLVMDGTDGAQVWSAASTANEKNISMDFPKGINVDALAITTLGSGTLYIYVG